MSLRLRVLLTILVVNLVVCGVLSVFFLGEDARLEALKREVHREKHFRRVLEKLCLYISAEWQDPHDYEAFRRLVAAILEWEDWHKHFHDVVVADLRPDPLGEGFTVPGRICFNPLGAARRGPDFDLGTVLAGMERSIAAGAPVRAGSGWCEAIRVFQTLRPVGAIYYEARIPPVEHRDVTLPLAIVGGFTLLLMLVLYLALSRYVVGPLEELAGKVAATAGGGPETPLTPARGTPEIRSLARTFEQTMGRINSFREELEREVARATGEVRKKERQLVLSSRLAAMGTLAAGIAHEINNPLGGLMNAARRIKETLPPGREAEEYLEIIEEGLDRIAQVVRRVLDFSPRRVEPAVFPLYGAAEKALALVEHRARRQGVQVVLQGDREVAVEGDQGEIQQVFLNLAMNGMDALLQKVEAQGSGFGPRLEIRIDRVVEGEEAWARGRVADNGPGLDPDRQERIFDLFYTTKEAGRGTGMGLAICFAILRNHGGSIELESEPGAGFTAEIRLPAAAEADRA